MNIPYIIDLEASGFGSDSYPIEVGLAMEEGERFCSLIYPDPSWTHWCDDAEKCHHIARSELLKHGKPLNEVAAKLNEILQDKTVYSDAWSWDVTWLNRLYKQAGLTMQFRVSPLEIIMNEAQVDIWDEVRNQVEKELQIARHRASNDALWIQQTYLVSRDIVKSRNQ